MVGADDEHGETGRRVAVVAPGVAGSVPARRLVTQAMGTSLRAWTDASPLQPLHFSSSSSSPSPSSGRFSPLRHCCACSAAATSTPSSSCPASRDDPRRRRCAGSCAPRASGSTAGDSARTSVRPSEIVDGVKRPAAGASSRSRPYRQPGGVEPRRHLRQGAGPRVPVGRAPGDHSGQPVPAASAATAPMLTTSPTALRHRHVPLTEDALAPEHERPRLAWSR